MNHTPDNNYDQNYYESSPENYAQFYETEMEQFEDNCGEPSNLQVPDVRLYADNIQNMTELYSRNSPFNDSLPPLEMPTKRIVNVVQPTEYFYDVPQHKHHYEPLAGTERPSALQPRINRYHYPHCNEYQSYTAGNSSTMQDRSLSHGRSEEIYVDDGYDDNCYSAKYPQNFSPHMCKVHLNKMQACTLHQNYGSYKMPPVEARMKSKKFVKDLYIDYREKNLCGHGNKVARGAPVRKQSVTMKTPKYFTKNVLPTTVSKRASVLCLPVVTQADPALTKRKSKTNHQIRKSSTQAKPVFATAYDQSDTFSTHKMHSQGDVKDHLAPKGFEPFLDKYEDNVVQVEDFYDVDPRNADQTEEHDFKEFAKFLKPRVPSSIKIRQEKLANIKAQKSLQPKLKLSLDKLLNRLQKCENTDNLENTSAGCPQVEPQIKSEKCNEKREGKIEKVNSFNYETLSRKCSPTNEESQVLNSGKNERDCNLFGSLEPKRSVSLLRPMDDHCALDLHKSKSYIVDLIDRALSKELGTVPRDQTVFNNLTPNKAVATISRQQHFNQRKGLCYEVTAALTDSIISNASAPPNLDSNQIVERSKTDGEMQEKGGEDSYIKQLKHLRWGHIRHIQHEARKLADLEEFLEKCGEIEY